MQGFSQWLKNNRHSSEEIRSFNAYEGNKEKEETKTCLLSKEKLSEKQQEFFIEENEYIAHTESNHSNISGPL